ncbi:MAG: SpoIIE family protein phosphatase [Chromatiaceae bacterium]|nr:SpoIIE family protein phosphatase [Chromatiaceae bacterium]
MVLNSYHKGYDWTDRVVDGIEEEFSGEENLELRIEYMDSLRLDPVLRDAVVNGIFNLKFAGRPIALIIATDDLALQTVLRYRDDLLPGVPVVFSGIEGLSAGLLSRMDNATGIGERTDFEGTLSLIRALHPDAQRLHVVLGTQREHLWTALTEAAGSGDSGLDLVRLPAGSAQELTAALAALRRDDPVLYLSFERDGTGTRYADRELLPTLARATSAPIYAMAEHLLGFGIVGGHLKSATEQGRMAARLGLRILQGEEAGTIPVVRESPHVNGFDFRQLQRFGISPGDLPEGSRIINEPDTFYYRYRHYLWPAVAAFVLLAAYAGSLRYNISKRKRAQRGLENLLEQAGNLLDPDAPAGFRDELERRIKDILPGRNEILLFRYSSPAAEFDVSNLVGPDTRNGADTAADGELLRRAAEGRRCVFERSRAALYFPNEDMPANLALVHADGPLDDIECDLLGVFAGNVAASAGNIQKYRMLETLATARRIQEAMLPEIPVGVGVAYGVQLHASLVAARSVSGDLYDVIPLDPERLFLAVGDVSDKGVPAALFMARTITLLRVVAEAEHDLAVVARRVNDELCRGNRMSMFVTLLLAVYHRGDGRLAFVNAGHDAPLVLRADGSLVAAPASGNVALGVVEGLDFAAAEMSIAPGDTLVVYTDGVTEAMDAGNRTFGVERLREALVTDVGSTAAEVAQSITDAVHRFAATAPQSDDLTLLCLRREP